MLLFTFVLLPFLCGVTSVVEKFNWNVVDFDFDCDDDRENALTSGEFIPERVIPFGIEIWKRKLFVTVPRRSPGIPSTLNYVDLDSLEKSPRLKPYPDWATNNASNADGIVSVYRISVDVCDRLWLVDNGAILNFGNEGLRIRPPRLQIYDLNKATLLKEYVLKKGDSKCDSAFTAVVADVKAGECDEAFAYIADPVANGLVVYSFRDDDSWRIQHPYFNPDPLQCDYTIGSLNFQWDDGLFGLGLDRDILYVHPMSSLTEFAVTTNLLKDAKHSKDYEAFGAVGRRARGHQSAATAFHQKSGIMFYSLVSKNGIGCWNSSSAYKPENHGLVAQDNSTMVYSSDVKLDKQDNLWFISNKLPFLLSQPPSENQVNFRIFTIPVTEITKRTPCEMKKPNKWYTTRV